MCVYISFYVAHIEVCDTDPYKYCYISDVITITINDDIGGSTAYIVGTGRGSSGLDPRWNQFGNVKFCNLISTLKLIKFQTFEL